MAVKNADVGSPNSPLKTVAIVTPAKAGVQKHAEDLDSRVRGNDGPGHRRTFSLENPEKNWKFSANDAKEREFWNDCMNAYEDMIRQTATKDAPWYVAPAGDKWFTCVGVASGIIDALASLDLSYPKVGREKLPELDAAKRALLAGT